MSNIIDFIPKEGLEAKRQLTQYIEWTKALTKGFDLHDSPMNFDKNDWGEWIGSCCFTKLGKDVRRKDFDPETGFLDENIINFAKAYVLHSQSMNRTQTITELPAIRGVECTLLDSVGVADITQANLNVFDKAATYIEQHYSNTLAYRIGRKLEALSRFITDKKISLENDVWVNTIKRPNDAFGHEKNKKDANKKMPNDAALSAIAEIWSTKPQHAKDIFVTSNCCLLLATPSRTGELNALAKDCLTYKKNKEGKEELFINWYGEKGYGYIDKPVPEIMREATEESINRIIAITQKPRKLAKFLEENPNEFPKHSSCPNIAQDNILTYQEALDALGLTRSGGSDRFRIKSWIESRLSHLNKKPSKTKSKAILKEALDGFNSDNNKELDKPTLTLRKLNTYLRECLLPEHFPYTTKDKKIKYKDALNCYFKGQLANEKAQGTPCLEYSLSNLNSNTLNYAISATKSKQNIFSRWGYFGDQYHMTTHQFRHYLNTIAAKGQIGEVERARWSARLDISQNSVYNHVSNEERVEQARKIGLGSQASNLSVLSKNKEPILLKDVGVHADRIAHYTMYGVCVHDFAMEPCTKFRDCLTCKKHKCIKGDEEKERRIKSLRDGLYNQLKEATNGVDQEFYGADKWLSYTMDRLEKANNLLEILNDDSIEDGAVIVCTDNGYSPLNKALSANGQLPPSSTAISSSTPKVEADLKKLKGLLEK